MNAQKLPSIQRAHTGIVSPTSQGVDLKDLFVQIAGPQKTDEEKDVQKQMRSEKEKFMDDNLDEALTEDKNEMFRFFYDQQHIDERENARKDKDLELLKQETKV